MKRKNEGMGDRNLDYFKRKAISAAGEILRKHFPGEEDQKVIEEQCSRGDIERLTHGLSVVIMDCTAAIGDLMEMSKY